MTIDPDPDLWAEPDLLTIDGLAQQSGMTVRTLRSHASRGLLQPPVMRGRVGYYGPAHRARLRFIRDMQDAGFSLGSIEQVLAGVPDDAGESMLAVIRGLLTPWRSEPPAVYDIDDLYRAYAPGAGPEHLAALVDMGAAEMTPDNQVRVVSPGLLAAGTEAVNAGLPLDGVLGAGHLVSSSAERVAERFVDLFRDSVWKDFVEAGMPEQDWGRIMSVHDRLQPVAVQAFLSAFQRAMRVSVSQALSQELGGEAQQALDRLLHRETG